MYAIDSYYMFDPNACQHTYLPSQYKVYSIKIVSRNPSDTEPVAVRFSAVESAPFVYAPLLFPLAEVCRGRRSSGRGEAVGEVNIIGSSFVPDDSFAGGGLVFAGDRGVLSDTDFFFLCVRGGGGVFVILCSKLKLLSLTAELP